MRRSQSERYYWHHAGCLCLSDRGDRCADRRWLALQERGPGYDPKNCPPFRAPTQGGLTRVGMVKAGVGSPQGTKDSSESRSNRQPGPIGFVL
jgi:hypothetical protein